jgi:LmbE family N-acetylglucosaminyl deacetylase
VVALPSSDHRSRHIVGEGTPESEWEEATVLRTLTPLDVRPCARAVVLSPHPDDETLGIGGLITSLIIADVPVTVVAATDGEASHPRSSPVIRELLRHQRPAEARAALSTLGAGKPPEVVRLALPDGELDRSEALLTEIVSQLLAPGDWCFATWERDGHPDHEAVARSAHAACDRVGARLVSYPIWMWHWATPTGAQLPWSRARRIPLSPHARKRKALAVDCFRSQIRQLSPTDPAILPPNDLAHFMRSFEMVFV